MASPAPMLHHPNSTSPTTAARKPKGILKNALDGTNLTSPPSGAIASSNSQNLPAPDDEPLSLDRPGLQREVSEKEITLQNTIANAGPRRNSSNARSSVSASRRQSSVGAADENSPRLKWDEANLYLTEQQRDSTMKIDEPKTPYVQQYDPAEDEAEIEAINAQELNVDELDMARARKSHQTKDDIPDLDLGEPEEAGLSSHITDGEKRVIVDDSLASQDGQGGHGEDDLSSMSAEARKKHLEFEERRKKHYEMKDVKGMLGHPEDLDAMDDEDR